MANTKITLINATAPAGCAARNVPAQCPSCGRVRPHAGRRLCAVPQASELAQGAGPEGDQPRDKEMADAFQQSADRLAGSDRRAQAVHAGDRSGQPGEQQYTADHRRPRLRRDLYRGLAGRIFAQAALRHAAAATRHRFDRPDGRRMALVVGPGQRHAGDAALPASLRRQPRHVGVRLGRLDGGQGDRHGLRQGPFHRSRQDRRLSQGRTAEARRIEGRSRGLPAVGPPASDADRPRDEQAVTEAAPFPEFLHENNDLDTPRGRSTGVEVSSSAAVAETYRASFRSSPATGSASRQSSGARSQSSCVRPSG